MLFFIQSSITQFFGEPLMRFRRTSHGACEGHEHITVLPFAPTQQD